MNDDDTLDTGPGYPITVDGRIAAALVTQHLRGLPGDPQVPEAYTRLTLVLTNQPLSVNHARAALDCFQEKFPSPKELTDTLYNLRSRFQEQAAAAPPPRKGAMEFRDQVLETIRAGTTDQFQLMKIQAVRDMLYYTEGAGKDEPRDRAYWTRARKYDLTVCPELVEAVRQAVSEGRTLTAEELKAPVQPERPSRGIASPIESPPLTAADLEAARQRYEATKETLRAEIAQDQAQREIEDAARAARQEQDSGRPGEEE